ncbi:gustatory and odorant receptor 24-like [Aethina tumida]|uniref:gustatory and odorant receptor 24-like n=1 Tax=Aethina tumida TaxID=116153 RepID=UPI002147F792|nr:gustatory and odorant receptor 24-like [Aethina tumida]
MYNQTPPNNSNNTLAILGSDLNFNKPRRSVYLESSQSFYQRHDIRKPSKVDPKQIQDYQQSNIRSFVVDGFKPMMYLLRIIGIFPIGAVGPTFQVTKPLLAYSIFIFLFVLGLIGYIRWDKVEIVRSAEGRFEEAVIDYLFTIYLVPILINPLVWYEARKQANVLTAIVDFEHIYNRIANKKLMINIGNAPLIFTILLPLLSCVVMVVTHITMVHFRILQVLPYCYVNTVTVLIGGSWFMYCDMIGKTATTISEDFQKALKNVGPSSNVADYRALWMMLSKIIRDVGNCFAFCVIFLCLYLFLIITLTIYGLLSQIQEGLGVKDIGLTVTALFSIALLYFICDEAHYASNCVKSHFQKKILLVELSWMNDDAQDEINMFLRATEMNPTDVSVGGFFDVNRTLFKSLLATMVTYLVVLLQFQISIPEDSTIDDNVTASITTSLPS